MIHNLTDKPPMSRTDKLCLVAIAGLMALTTVVYEITDGQAVRAAEADKPLPITITAPPIDCTPLVEAVEARREAARAERYDQAVPLNRELQDALWEACETNGVPVCLALGLIETESGFQLDVVSSEGCYGLMQLNARWFPSGLSPEDNVRAGVAHLGALLKKYNGDTQAALTAYNAGSDTGSRTYARRVLDASSKWGCG